jgi:hypothetical protein
MENGAGDRSRTYDLLITSQLLYQLSYASLTEAVRSEALTCFAFYYLLIKSASNNADC